MSEEVLESLPELLPADFFAIECDVGYTEEKGNFPSKMEKHYLPDTSFLLNEESFADVGLLWNERGLFGQVEVHEPFQESVYPEVKEGDSIELFLDTRNLKTAGFATRFCHHFVILPAPINGIQCKELTRFRSEDSHPIAETLAAEVKATFLKKGYLVQFFLKKEALFGFDPSVRLSLGFTYRINRYKKRPQHFSVSSLFYPIEQQPSLWATLHLKKGKV